MLFGFSFDSEFGSCDQFRLHEALWQSQTMFNDVGGKVATKKILLVSCTFERQHFEKRQFSF